MAVTKTVIKNTNQETVVKIGGTAGSATIDLQTDCLADTQALSGNTQTVNIVSTVHSGLLSSAITVTRNSVPILAIAAENNGKMVLNDMGFVDTQENTSDIVVTIAGSEAHIFLKLSKVGGYATKVETATYSIYDDVTKVGE
jgi:hypothetical protein